MFKTWKKSHPTVNKQKKVMKEYIAKKPSHVSFSGGKVSLRLGSDYIKSEYMFKPHVTTIGRWMHNGKNMLVIDRDVQSKNLKPLLVHEATEQFMQKQKGLTYWRAHQVATDTEKDYVHSKKKNWRRYQNSVIRTRV